MPRQREYAIYKGDEFITLGSAQECAKKLDVTPDYIKWMTYPICRKRNKGNRMTAIVIEEGEDE